MVEAVRAAEIGDAAFGGNAGAAEKHGITALIDHLPQGLNLIVHIRRSFGGSVILPNPGGPAPAPTAGPPGKIHSLPAGRAVARPWLGGPGGKDRRTKAPPQKKKRRFLFPGIDRSFAPAIRSGGFPPPALPDIPG